MRYLLDTNIFVYAATDRERLDADVKAILSAPETLLYLSIESVRELIVGYNSKGLCTDRWKSAEAMVKAIEDEFYIEILPLNREDMLTYARLVTDTCNGHKDPSDHVIISQAITSHIPLISSDRRFEFYRKQGLDLIFNKK